ncbi:hypothetical protein D9M71_721610 [compost metagenome]
MCCIQSCTAAARARDNCRFCSALPVASVWPLITMSQPGWASMSTRALIRTLVEPGLSWALPVLNSDRLSRRTGFGLPTSLGASDG